MTGKKGKVYLLYMIGFLVKCCFAICIKHPQALLKQTGLKVFKAEKTVTISHVHVHILTK